MAALPDREPDLPEEGGERSETGAAGSPLSERLRAADQGRLALVGFGITCLFGLALALNAHVKYVSAIPSVARTAVVGVALFALCGYAAARALVRGELSSHWTLMVLPLGAAISALSLGVMGILHVPLTVSLVVLIAAAAAAAVRVGLPSRGEPATDELQGPDRSARIRVGLPLFVAAMVGLISLIPILRAGYAGVPGENGDAILVVGSAVLLEHAPPTAVRENLPINRVPVLWRSKYPIYYPLAAISKLAGQDPIAAFAPVTALMLAVFALGLFLVARYMLRAQPWAALFVLLIVPLDRIVTYVTVHPYYNELWGQFTLPFMLLFGFRYLKRPERRGGALFLLFGVLGLLAYPLMFPFPVAFLGVHAWRVYRTRREAGERVGWVAALRLPRPRERWWLWIPIAVVAIPVAAVLLRGFVEKTSEALAVLPPWTSLAAWHGNALPFLPLARFFGMPESGGVVIAALAVIFALAAIGLRKLPSDARAPMAAMVGLGALIGAYFRTRNGGELFFFKDMAFLGPYVVMLALLAIWSAAKSRSLWPARLGLVGVGLALFVIPASGAHEIDKTYEQTTPSVLALRTWNRELPRGSSVRIDVPPSGYQVWVSYMLVDHPVTSLDPLGGIFPHPPFGRKADYVIANTAQPKPLDAIGRPVLQNSEFTLWRMNPRVPGRAPSSRYLVNDIEQAQIG